MPGLGDYLNPSAGLGAQGGFMQRASSFRDQNPGALTALGAGIMAGNPAAGFAGAAPMLAAAKTKNMTVQYLLSKGFAKSPEEAMALAANPVLLAQTLKAATAGDDETFYGQPLYTEDAQGNLVANQIGNHGTFKPIDLGGNKLVSSTKQINTPTEVITTDRFGNELFRTPKDNRQAAADRAIGTYGGEQAAAAPTDIQAGQIALQTVDDLRVDPNRETGTGMSSVFNGIYASPGKDFQSKFDKAKAGAFLTAIQQMRGLGSLSNAEGDAATKAVTSMSTSTSEGEFLSALDRYEEVIRKGIAKAQARQQQYGTELPGISDAATVPPGGGAGNKRLRFNPATGELE